MTSIERPKSSAVAFRLAVTVSSRRWNSGSWNGQVSLEESDEDQPSAWRDEVEGGTHRGRVAGRIEHQGRELAAHRLPDGRRWRRSRGRGRATLDQADANARRSSLTSASQVWMPPTTRCAGDRQTDRTGTDDERAVAGHGRPARHGVASDRERLDEGELVERQGRRRDAGPSPARADARACHRRCAHPRTDERVAGVLEASPAGIARAAPDGGSDRGPIPRRHTVTRRRRPRATSTASSWPEDPGIAHERLAAAEGVDVRAADPDTPDADERLVRARNDGSSTSRSSNEPGSTSTAALTPPVLPGQESPEPARRAAESSDVVVVGGQQARSPASPRDRPRCRSVDGPGTGCGSAPARCARTGAVDDPLAERWHDLIEQELFEPGRDTRVVHRLADEGDRPCRGSVPRARCAHR